MTQSKLRSPKISLPRYTPREEMANSAIHGLGVGLSVAALAVLVSRQDWSWRAWTGSPAETLAATSPVIKLIAFMIYLTLCTTFFPLPTGWIVAAVATREAAIAAGVSDSAVVVAAVTTVAVATVGGIGSTIANLNDYHLFTWMLRHRGIARGRNSRAYLAASRWFAKNPMLILIVFSMIPIPVDVVRMLATTYRYRRQAFAAANFIGRFARYGVIAFVTYWWDLGWIAVLALLALAVVLGATRVLPATWKRISARRANNSD